MSYKKIVASSCVLLAGWCWGSGEVLSSEEGVFQKAVILYKDKNYSEAYPLFEKLFLQKSDDPRINFYLGVTALELRKYDDALIAFERVLLVDPLHLRTKLELGRLYFEEGNYETAKSYFDDLMQQEIPANVKENIQKYLVVIESTQKKHFLSGVVSLGWGYENNLNNGIGSGKTYSITLPSIGDSSVNGDAPVSDHYLQMLTSLTHTYKASRYETWFWQNNALVLRQRYQDEGSKNVDYLKATTALGMTYENHLFLTSIGVSDLRYGGINLLKEREISERWSSKISPQLICLAQGTLKEKRYESESNKGQDTNIREVNVGVNYMPQTQWMVSANLAKAKEKRVSDTNNNISNHSTLVSLNSLYQAGWGIDVNVGWSYKKTFYDDPDTLDNSVIKKDTAISQQCSVSKTIDKFMYTASVSQMHNFSTLERSEYKKHNFLLSVSYSF